MKCDYNTAGSLEDPIPCGKPAVVEFQHWVHQAGRRQGNLKRYPRCKVHSSERVREIATQQGYSIHEV